MRAYVDHVLAVLPTSRPEAMGKLGGPHEPYVGIARIRRQCSRGPGAPTTETGKCRSARAEGCLLLPRIARSEVSRLLPTSAKAAEELAERHEGIRFLLPTVPRQEDRVRALNGILEGSRPR